VRRKCKEFREGGEEEALGRVGKSGTACSACHGYIHGNLVHKAEDHQTTSCCTGEGYMLDWETMCGFIMREACVDALIQDTARRTDGT